MIGPPTQIVDVSGCGSFVIVTPCRLHCLRDAAFLREVSRNEFLRDVSSRFTHLFDGLDRLGRPPSGGPPTSLPEQGPSSIPPQIDLRPKPFPSPSIQDGQQANNKDVIPTQVPSVIPGTYTNNNWTATNKTPSPASPMQDALGYPATTTLYQRRTHRTNLVRRWLVYNRSTTRSRLVLLDLSCERLASVPIHFLSPSRFRFFVSSPPGPVIVIASFSFLVFVSTVLVSNVNGHVDSIFEVRGTVSFVVIITSRSSGSSRS